MSIGGIGGFSASSLASRILSRSDTDSSGAVSLEEFKSAAGTSSTDTDLSSKLEEMFSSFDGDSDGSLSSSEIATGIQSFADGARQALLSLQEASGGESGFGPPPGMGGPGAAGGPPPKPSESFATDDTDSSGGLSLEEFTAAGEARGMPADDDKAAEIFSSMDADGDGSVTLSEMESFEEDMAANGPPGSQSTDSSDLGIDVSQLLQGLAQYSSVSKFSDLASLFETAA